MKNFGILISGKLQELKMPIRTETEQIFTNDEALIKSYGYKPVIYTEPEAKEGFYASGFNWTETDTEIVQEWICSEITSDF